MIHANEFTRKGFCEELLFNDNSVLDDFLDLLFCWFVDQVREHQAGKITVKTLEGTEILQIKSFKVSEGMNHIQGVSRTAFSPNRLQFTIQHGGVVFTDTRLYTWHRCYITLNCSHTSSRLMSSFEKVSPGILPLGKKAEFFRL